MKIIIDISQEEFVKNRVQYNRFNFIERVLHEELENLNKQYGEEVFNSLIEIKIT